MKIPRLPAAEVYRRINAGETAASLARLEGCKPQAISRRYLDEHDRGQREKNRINDPDRISYSQLPIRVRNILINAGFTHFRDLHNVHRQRIAQEQNMGITSMTLLENHLRQYYPNITLLPHLRRPVLPATTLRDPTSDESHT
jgi:hypothetical protein